MTRSPEDWDAWGPETTGVAGVPSAYEILHQLVTRLPDRRRATVAVFGRAPAGTLPRLASCCGRVLAVASSVGALERARRDGGAAELRRLSLDDLRPLRSHLDVAIALGAFASSTRADVDRALRELHASLVEGGLLVVTFPALPAGSRPYLLWPRAEAPERGPYHQFEAQYRLRRAGFRGMRLRHMATPGTAPELLAFAVRRACN